MQSDESPTVEDYENQIEIKKDSVAFHSEPSKLRFSLFDLFRPLAMPTHAPENLKSGSTLSNDVQINITFSPPVHWTFCEPICGVGDQAVDAENAKEIARDDVIEAYYPESVLVEDFGPYFDLSGNRYRISGKTIPFKINNKNPGIVSSFSIPLKIKFQTFSPISSTTAGKLRQKIIDFLSARKFLHILKQQD
ncbi:unnamed protein product [Caenorhabditis bovis]|uniref:Uncharacterized protein n=1 Tax=Caenorhabditis bovis TaxID=2654633 RepID=A0A8S1EED6_9PELO|nr:unnamed protein product [Caenorhabditis bovis]